MSESACVPSGRSAGRADFCIAVDSIVVAVVPGRRLVYERQYISSASAIKENPEWSHNKITSTTDGKPVGSR